MNVRHVLRWCVPLACLVAAELYAGSAEAAPLVAQPSLTQAVAPATVGFHRHGWGYYGGYRGWGSYYYGRPSLYYGYRYRPYRSVVRYSYRPSYSYGYASPYYGGGYVGAPYYGGAYVGNYGGYYGYRPIAYTQPIYSTGYYRPVSYYSGYSAYSYPSYGTIGFGGRGYGYGYGYSTISPYYSGGFYGGYW